MHDAFIVPVQVARPLQKGVWHLLGPQTHCDSRDVKVPLHRDSPSARVVLAYIHVYTYSYLCSIYIAFQCTRVVVLL